MWEENEEIPRGCHADVSQQRVSVKKAGIGEWKSGTSTAQLKAAPDTESFMGKRKGGKERGILQAESTGLFCLGSIFNSETTKKT